MKMRNWIILLALLVLGLGVLVLRPVPIPEEKECLSLNGTVSQIYAGGANDLVIKLKGVDREFYVNRGLERGLDLKMLQAELTNKQIVIKYPKYWTPLNPDNSVRHISKIEFDGRIIFTELDK